MKKNDENAINTLNTSNAQQLSLDESYEQLLEKVELILTQLDKKDIPLNDAIKQYKDGMQLINACNEMLDRAEKELRMIEGE